LPTAKRKPDVDFAFSVSNKFTDETINRSQQTKPILTLSKGIAMVLLQEGCVAGRERQNLGLARKHAFERVYGLPPLAQLRAELPLHGGHLGGQVVVGVRGLELLDLLNDVDWRARVDDAVQPT